MGISRILLVTALAGCGTMLLQAGPTLDREMLAAAEHGNIERIRDLVAKGANINASDEDGYGVVALALSNDHDKIIPGILKITGFDINAKSKMGTTLLFHAIAGVNLERVTLFLDNGALVEGVMVPGPNGSEADILTFAVFLADMSYGHEDREQTSRNILRLIADKSTTESIKKALANSKWEIMNKETKDVLQTVLKQKTTAIKKTPTLKKTS